MASEDQAAPEAMSATVRLPRIPQTPSSSLAQAEAAALQAELEEAAAANAAAAEVQASAADEEATDDEDEEGDLRARIWTEVRRQLFVGT